jgi:hypothetical protein
MMRVKTILKRVQEFESFVYSAVRWVDGTSVEPARKSENKSASFTLQQLFHEKVHAYWGVSRSGGLRNMVTTS